MSDKRKIKLNIMDIGRFMDKVVHEDWSMVLDGLYFAAQSDTKSKVLEVKYDSSSYKFEMEGKILRRDYLELTYRYVK